jgi:hypothetical protein
MNTHKNARLTFARRLEMVLDMVSKGLAPPAAASGQGRRRVVKVPFPYTDRSTRQ